MMKNYARTLLTLTTTLLAFNINAQEEPFYKPAHDEICYELKNYKIECGNFNLNSTILSRKYKITDTGSDVMASFSASTHPGDHPFLKKLAKNLGYTDSIQNSDVNQSLFTWNTLSVDVKNKIIKRYSDIGSTPELKNNLSAYLKVCINYWSNPKATHDKRKDDPTIAETSALCIADSGVL